jgi:hypothetical protein
VIFTSLGLLLVALGFLIAGIAKSSVALLMVALFVTIGAGVVLILVTAAAQRIVAAQQPQATTVVDLTSNGAGAPVVGYDDMTAEQVVRLVRSGALSDEQLSLLVAYEEGHQARKTVLDRAGRATASR